MTRTNAIGTHLPFLSPLQCVFPHSEEQLAVAEKKIHRLDVKMLMRWMWRDFYIQNRTRSITKADPPDSSPPTSLVLLGTLSDMILSRRWSISLPSSALSLIPPLPSFLHILVDPISPFFPHALIHLLRSSVSWMVFLLNVILIFKLQNN